MNFELVIIGAGPGGYAAALAAGRNGLKTALVESGPLGGTCLNKGCVPTKLLLGTTSPEAELDGQKRLRLARGEISFDLAAVQNRKKILISATRKSMQDSLEKAGITIVQGRARLDGPGRLVVEDETIKYSSLILAMGSRSGSPPAVSPDHDRILTSTSALELETVPESLAVIGAGPVGIELAEIFSRLGTEITLIEALDSVAPHEDPQIGLELTRYFKRKKWVLKTGVRVESVSPGSSGLVIRLDSGQEVEVEKCLVATGRLPAGSGMNLKSADIQTQGPGWIKTDQYLRAAPGIYAVGDVNGKSMYAHAASHQAEYAVAHILGAQTSPYPFPAIPSCIYGSMEVVRTGILPDHPWLREKEIKVSKAMTAANPIVQGHGLIQGFIKVFWSQGRVTGITGAGHGLSGLVNLCQVITQQQWTKQEARQYIFAHPTLDETLKEALLAPWLENG
ncbi:dihydrolipoyl dehydrogenase family protein [Desulfonatronovibrio hydrogenovorans]|uniref:dihydrolipoyl dehydrogenase family protein n=1 Tax=Desulfonatronovibrio hydrogenovorans TaxID=53245 RepID=UPI000491E00A|nr:NAD(P)/FAD-dependent oxidoreductase [Desulfonatronovibrio hydrogenovorans]